MDQVDPFQCADRKLQAAYKHRHLRAAFCNVQHPKNQAAVTTKARFVCWMRYCTRHCPASHSRMHTLSRRTDRNAGSFWQNSSQSLKACAAQPPVGYSFTGSKPTQRLMWDDAHAPDQLSTLHP